MFNDDATRWTAVISRDAHADGSFVYAVATTNIYCRPTCKARRARRANVTFFTESNLAETAGFRPCKRCRPELASKFEPDKERIARACDMLQNLSVGASMPTLEQLATAVGLSKYHFHRLFKRETGVTPRDYLLERRSSTGSGSTPGSAASPLHFVGSAERLVGGSWIRGLSSSEVEELDRTADAVQVYYCIVDSDRGRLLAAFQQQFVSWTAEGIDDVDLMRQFEAAFPPLFYRHIHVSAINAIEAESMLAQLKALVGREDSLFGKVVIPPG